MRYDELITACINCINSFNPKIETEDSFAETFLKKLTKDTNERMFIKQVFYGVLRYKAFLKIFTESLFTSKPSSTERKDETLFHVFAYLTIFRLNELPLDDYKQLVISQDSVKMNEFYTYLFDENVLRNKLRPEWIECYDFNYVDSKIIGGLLETQKTIQDLLSFILNKARAGNLSSTADSTLAPSDSADVAQSQQKTKKVTIPEPFNLTQPKPRVFQEPKQICNKFVMTPVPIEAYQKTSLSKIEEDRKARAEITKKNVLEKYAAAKPVKFKTDERPTNLEKIREEVEQQIQSTLQFDNKYVTPLKDYSNIGADVKYNEAAILREENLIKKREKEEQKELERLLVEKKDSKEFDRWVSEMKLKDDILKMQKIQKRKLELELNREVASNYMQQRIKKNQLKAAEHKQQELKNLQKRKREKAREIHKKQLLVQEINKEKENIPILKEQQKLQNQEMYKNQVKEYNELNLIAKEELKIENQRRDDLIRQIRELEKIPMKRTKGFDPTETPGYGLLEEMSLVELRERLELQKKMLQDEIQSKKEENKLKMEERADWMYEKANRIAEHRDKLRNQKEVERKMRKEALKQKEEMIRMLKEQSLFEVKQKIETKKEKLRKEDEEFQKKIREIQLQRQFLQLGRAAVEAKAFKQIEDGLERKINDRQNQDLVNQQKQEEVNWNAVKLRYNSAKEDVKRERTLLQNYKQVYETTKAINDMCNDEDKRFKQAVHDREVGLARFQNEVLKERNKFSDALQAGTMKKRNVKSSKKETPQLAQEAVVAPIEENKDAFEEDEEENQIKSKLENESMKEKEALPA